MRTDSAHLDHAETPLSAQRSAISTRHAALVRWQRAAGPYWPYVCAAPFLDAANVGGLADPGGRGIARLIRPLKLIPTDERSAVFVDLPPLRALAATERLNRLGFIVVPVIQRWIATPAILRCEPLVAGLVAYAAVARWPDHYRGVVFVLDGERGGRRSQREGAPPRVFDNRYNYPICRFPPPSFLRRQEIATIWWVSAGGIAEDLQPYADLFKDADFPVQIWTGACWQSDGADAIGPSDLSRSSESGDRTTVEVAGDAAPAV